MTGAQPNSMEHLAGTVGDRTADTTVKPEAEPQPEYVGDLPDDPEEARTYRPGEDDAGAGTD